MFIPKSTVMLRHGSAGCPVLRRFRERGLLSNLLPSKFEPQEKFSTDAIRREEFATYSANSIQNQQKSKFFCSPNTLLQRHNHSRFNHGNSNESSSKASSDDIRNKTIAVVGILAGSLLSEYLNYSSDDLTSSILSKLKCDISSFQILPRVNAASKLDDLLGGGSDTPKNDSSVLQKDEPKFISSFEILPRVHAASKLGDLGSDTTKNKNSSAPRKEKPAFRALNNYVADTAEYLAPTVVQIESVDRRRPGAAGQNSGSGLIVAEDGLILTNAHVVLNQSRKTGIRIRLSDGRMYEGKIEQVDNKSDLALLRVKETNLPTATLGDSSSLRAGEFVVAIGSPLCLSNTVTFGVVGNIARSSQEMGIPNDINYIQTDASINFGNSGGPLATLDGDVIGINALKASPGISFAIPSNVAKKFIEDYQTKKKNKEAGLTTTSAPTDRRFLGITMLSLTPEILAELRHSSMGPPLSRAVTHGVMVWKVVVGSPAYHAGLSPHDVITEINGHKISSAPDVYRLLERGGNLIMVVMREEVRYTVVVTPEET